MVIGNLLSHKRVLFVDPSGSHSAYTVLELTSNSATILCSNMIWTKDTWSKGEKFSYLRKAFEFVIKYYKVDAVYAEDFFVNPKQPQGSSIIPVVNGIIQMVCFDNNIKEFSLISPTYWRKILDIKPIISINKGKKQRDYKTPTINKVISIIGKISDTIPSNVNTNERQTPHDIYDVLAIAISMCKDNNINKFDKDSKIVYNIDYLERIRNLK
jgi:Holliday junction resolvasome RuvABC endonuclease subunit